MHEGALPGLVVDVVNLDGFEGAPGELPRGGSDARRARGERCVGSGWGVRVRGGDGAVSTEDAPRPDLDGRGGSGPSGLSPSSKGETLPAATSRSRVELGQDAGLRELGDEVGDHRMGVRGGEDGVVRIGGLARGTAGQGGVLGPGDAGFAPKEAGAGSPSPEASPHIRMSCGARPEGVRVEGVSARRLPPAGVGLNLEAVPPMRARASAPEVLSAVTGNSRANTAGGKVLLTRSGHFARRLASGRLAGQVARAARGRRAMRPSEFAPHLNAGSMTLHAVTLGTRGECIASTSSSSSTSSGDDARDDGPSAVRRRTRSAGRARLQDEASRDARVSAASTFSSRGERPRAGRYRAIQDRIVPRAMRLRLVRFRRQSRRRGQARVRRVRQGTQGAVPRRRHRQLSEVHPRQRGAHRQRGRHRSVQVFQVDEAAGGEARLERPGVGRKQREESLLGGEPTVIYDVCGRVVATLSSQSVPLRELRGSPRGKPSSRRRTTDSSNTAGWTSTASGARWFRWAGSGAGRPSRSS